MQWWTYRLQTLHAFTRHSHLTDFIYIALEQPIKIEVDILQGTNIICKYDFNDTAESIETTDRIVSYQYKQEGKFFPTVTCFNSISSAFDSVNGTIIVEKLESITGLKIMVGRTLFGEEASIQAVMVKGSVFVCHWDLGDGEKLIVDKRTFNNVIRHQYNAIGDYKLKLTCTNGLGTVTDVFTLPVDKPINGLGVSCPNQFVTLNENLKFYVVTDKGIKIDLPN